jgi:hypothetical protein
MTPAMRETGYDMTNHGWSSIVRLLAYLPLTDLLGGKGSEPHGVKDVT